MIFLKGLVRLIRLGTVLSAMVVTALGGYVAAGSDPDWMLVALAALSVGLILGAADAVNDIVDVEIDRVNKPWRPIPSGAVSKRVAYNVAGLLAIVGLGIAVFLGREATILCTLAVGVSFLYAIFLRKIPLVKNITVAGITAITVVYGAISTGNIPVVVLVMSFVVFWCIMARETIKDIADVAGDIAGGVTTFVSHAGIKTSKRLVIAYLLFTIVGLIWSLSFFNSLYGAISLVAIGGLIFVGTKITANETPEQFEQISRLLKYAFLLWFAALLFGV